jgi:hypothetical protein
MIENKEIKALIPRTEMFNFSNQISLNNNLSQKFMMISPHEGLKRKGWDISVKTFVLENGNNSLFAGSVTKLSPSCKLT